MKQLIINSQEIHNGQIIITGELFNHIVNALRISIGTYLNGLDKNGNKYLLQLIEINKKSCLFTIQTKGVNSVEGPEITLIQCLPKAAKMETIIRQVTEIGINRIIPCISENSFYQEENIVTHKLIRWQKIINESIQQSDTNIFTKITEPINIKMLEPIETDQVGFFFHQEKIDEKKIHHFFSYTCKHVFYIIGPEGGLSKSDINIVQAKGFIPMYIGHNILRTDTAAVYALSIIDFFKKEIIHGR